MEIFDLILNLLTRHHIGIDSAIPRRALLNFCQDLDPDIDDREMRRIVKTIPKVCTCENGYYIARDKSEVEHSIRYLKKKIFPLWADINRLMKDYPEFFQGEQMSLFEMEGR
jgi:hypothetical protein